MNPQTENTQKQPTESQPATLGQSAGRRYGKGVIEDIIHRLRRRAEHLQTLLDMLPSNPTPDQDEALWQVATGMERV